MDTSGAALEAARTDRSGHRSAAAPLAVVRARSAADVQPVCRAWHTPRAPGAARPVVGAGPGVVGHLHGGRLLPDVTAGAAAITAISGDGLVPAIVELMDEATLAAVRAHAADDDAARLPETGSGASALIGAGALSSGRRSSDRSVRG